MEDYPHLKILFAREEAFYELLNSEFDLTDFRCEISFEYVNENKIFSFKFVNDNLIRLKVNLNIGKESMFKGLPRALNYSLRYRASYIGSYVHLLDSAKKRYPEKYFSGLVTLCAINDRCSRKYITSYSPDPDKRPETVRPIDIECALRSLVRIVNDEYNYVEEVKARCYLKIDGFISYSMLPEIGYRRSMPVYSLASELNALEENLKSQQIQSSDYAMLSKGSFGLNENPDLGSYIEACVREDDIFWSGVFVRLLGYEGCITSVSGLESARKAKEYTRSFREDCVRYCTENCNAASYLLNDNETAIKRISRILEGKINLSSDVCGGLHNLI